jgi:glycosyltransferase involved in cell wall biosynthesis
MPSRGKRRLDALRPQVLSRGYVPAAPGTPSVRDKVATFRGSAMRICHIIESCGGSGQVVIDLTREGLAAGDDITVIAAPSRAERFFYSALSSMPGLRLLSSPMRREIGGHDLIDAWHLFRCLRSAGPFDVIHAHSSKAGALARICGLFFPQAIKVYTPHAFVTMGPEVSYFYVIIEKILSLFSDAIILVSDFEKEHALNHIGIDKTRVAVIPNGIQTKDFSDRAKVRRELGYEDDEFVLGFVGRLTPQKNPLRLVEAFVLALQQRPDLKLAIAGEGELRVAIEGAIILRGIANQVRFIAGKRGRDIIAGFDGLVCSSDYEGFPIVFLEALAAAVPIVVTPVGGARECVVEGQTGYIADGFSAEALARAMLKLIALDSENRSLMAEVARGRAQLFNIERIAGEIRALYESIAERKKKRRNSWEKFNVASRLEAARHKSYFRRQG